MVFKRMISAFGADAPSMDTILATPRTQPGGTLAGEVRLKGGDVDAGLEGVALVLVARVEPAQAGAGEQSGFEEFLHAQISGPSLLRRGEERVIGFQIMVPWETPISEIGGRHLTGPALGVRTEVAGATAVEQGDLDMVVVKPAPSQLRVLQAFPQLGFYFKGTVLEMGRLNGVHQDLPFYQRIEFYPPYHHAGAVHEVELAFVSSRSGLAVVLKADQHSARHPSGGAIGRFEMSHEEALHTDWPSEVDRWLMGLTHARGQQHEQQHRGEPGYGR
ncbi:sporulation protein [Nonomuraea sp. LPB2021202275-12-8]|uniref:sporulation protein n=1 Tax=Nonomuraea sp. LPB2021202275-12-8 TaxID=3120159 RepID=UPI00300CEFB7